MITDKDQILNYHLPRWNELPELDLYMDQVISIIDKYLAPFAPASPDERLITPTMINNYVKQHMVAAPSGKKYDRSKVAFFMIIALLKRVMSMSELASLKKFVIDPYTYQEAYDLFCSELETAIRAVFSGAKMPSEDALSDSDEYNALRAIAVAFATKFYVQTILQRLMQAAE